MYRDVVPATVDTRVAVKRVANMLQGGVVCAGGLSSSKTMEDDG